MAELYLRNAIEGLGFSRRPVAELPEDASLPALRQKVTNPGIVAALGADPMTVEACYHLEMSANLLDTYCETGDERYLALADESYAGALALVAPEVASSVHGVVGAALGYFLLEKAIARRIRLGDSFSESEVLHWHLSRGADSFAYAELVRSSVESAEGLVTAFRM